MYVIIFSTEVASPSGRDALIAPGENPGGAARAQSVAERRPRTHAPNPPHPPTGGVTAERRRKSRRRGGGSDAPVAAVAPETNTARYCESVILRL